MNNVKDKDEEELKLRDIPKTCYICNKYSPLFKCPDCEAFFCEFCVEQIGEDTQSFYRDEDAKQIIFCPNCDRRMSREEGLLYMPRCSDCGKKKTTYFHIPCCSGTSNQRCVDCTEEKDPKRCKYRCSNLHLCKECVDESETGAFCPICRKLLSYE